MTVVVIDAQEARSFSGIQQTGIPLLAPSNTLEQVDCGRFRGVSGDPFTGIAYQERTILDGCTLANSDRGALRERATAPQLTEAQVLLVEVTPAVAVRTA